jgi:hypothetical protein
VQEPFLDLPTGAHKKKGPCVLAAHGPFGIYHSHQARLFVNRTFDRRLASIARNWRRRKDFVIQTDLWPVKQIQLLKIKVSTFHHCVITTPKAMFDDLMIAGSSEKINQNTPNPPNKTSV